MSSNSFLPSYVVATEADVPRHLKDRSPTRMSNTEMILRQRREDVVGSDGRVMMAGAIEFQTQVRPGVLTDMCDPNEIYKPEMRDSGRFRVVYDPEIQRGVKESKTGVKEFLREAQINMMMEDIRKNRFECPQLAWNLRAGEVQWVYAEDTHSLLIYQGVATRPDTNHRHHSIIRMHRRYTEWVRTTGSEAMEEYNPDRAYGLVIYTDDFKGEAHRFYVFNFLGWRVSTSTAHYIESKTDSPHAHSKLAREVMDECGILGTQNVEIMGNQLSKNSAKMITFGTLVEALKAAFPAVPEEEKERGELRQYVIEYLAELGRLRPNEIALLSVAKRQEVREKSVVDQSTLWHGHLKLAAWLRSLDQQRGYENGSFNWKNAIKALALPFRVDADGEIVYDGDFFGRSNPIWASRGVVAPNKSGTLRVVNNRQSREAAFEAMREIVESHIGMTQPALVIAGEG